MIHRHGPLAVFLSAALLLGGCGVSVDSSVSPPGPTMSKSIVQATPLPGTTGGGFTAPEFAESTFHPEAALGTDDVLLDTSCLNEGIVAVSAAVENGLKFQVIHGETVYNYDLPNDGTPECFVLQSGDGLYNFRVMRNTTGSKYAVLYTAEAEVVLDDEFAPFLRPSQMVAYTAESECVALAAKLAAEAQNEAGVVANIYAYIRDNIKYDIEKAQSVESGYLPNPDETLRSGKAICYEYGALAAAMLRSQGIPTKLITGYVSPDDLYHAWNMVWLEDEGWITVSLKAAGGQWERIDLTFAAGAGSDFSADDFTYTEHYIY